MVDSSNENLEKTLSRREMVRLGAVCCGAVIMGCTHSSEEVPFEMEIGAASDLSEGITVFPLHQVGVVRREGEMWAVRLVCTHQRCGLVPHGVETQELLCPCHGSRFALEGEVLQGPAEMPLTRYPVKITEHGTIVITRARRI